MMMFAAPRGSDALILPSLLSNEIGDCVSTSGLLAVTGNVASAWKADAVMSFRSFSWERTGNSSTVVLDERQ